MTLLIPGPDTGATVAAPAPPDAVPAQRPASDTGAPGLLAATSAARRALSGSCGSDSDAVVWLSEHLAALDRVLYPAVARSLHQDVELRAQRAATHRLALLLRRLHAWMSGDGAAGSEDLPTLRRALVAALDEHAAAESALLTRLRRQLSADEWKQLTAQYTERLRRGPTRPHPHTPRTGAAGRLAYRVTAWADHVLDVVDSRGVRPVPMTDAALSW